MNYLFQDRAPQSIEEERRSLYGDVDRIYPTSNQRSCSAPFLNSCRLNIMICAVYNRRPADFNNQFSYNDFFVSALMLLSETSVNFDQTFAIFMKTIRIHSKRLRICELSLFSYPASFTSFFIHRLDLKTENRKITYYTVWAYAPLASVILKSQSSQEAYSSRRSPGER